MRRTLFITLVAALITAFAFVIIANAGTAAQVFNGGTGTSTAPTYGQLLIGGKNGEYELVASSTLDGGSGFSTTSTAYWLTQQSTSNLSEGSNLYFTNARAVAALTGQSNTLFTNGSGYLTSLVGAASSTLLSDNNTFSGSNIFSQPLSLTSTTGTTTIASGQGFTIGTKELLVQGTTGEIGINTLLPLALLHLGGTYTTPNSTAIYQSTTLNSSITTTQYGALLQPTINPSGASLNNLYGVLAQPTLSASSNVVPSLIFVGIASQPRISSSTAIVPTGIGFYSISPSNTGSSYFSIFRGFQTGIITNGDGITSGLVTNVDFYGNNNTASSSAGGTINNYTGEFIVPIGAPSGGITNNRGLYITGNGGNSNNGGTANNYAFYSDSTANSYFAGNVGIGTTNPTQKLQVAGQVYASSTVISSGTLTLAALGTPAGSFLAVDPNGVVIATTTPIGGTASSTLLGDNNTFGGINSFTQGIFQNGSLILTTPATSTLVGVGAGGALTGAQFGGDVVIGQSALNTATSTIGDVAIGYRALKNEITTNNSGSVSVPEDTAVGWQSLQSLTSGDLNTAVGYNTLSSITTGAGDNCFGVNCGDGITIGGNNSYFGNGISTQANASGGQNSALGGQSLHFITSGSGNLAAGYQSGSTLSSGNSNVYLGAYTASTTATGSGNITIGYDISGPQAANNGSNMLDIGNLIFGTGLTSQASSTSAGKVGIGTTTPDALLTLSANSGSTYPDNNLFEIASSTSNATTTLFAVTNTGNVGIGTTTFSNLLTLGTIGSTNGTSTIGAGKIQIDGYNTTGSRICMYVVGTTLTINTGACTP